MIPGIPPAVLSVVVSLVGIIVKLVQSGGDRAAREEALMDGAELLKAQLDRERFGDG